MSDDYRKELDSFNDHQKDNRNRATQLANYAFLLAGGSFTASVSVFVARPKDQITKAIAELLHEGWYSLFLAIIAYFTMLTFIVLRDYVVAEVHWRPVLDGKQPYLSGKKYTTCFVVFEIVILSAGIFGFYKLSYGLYDIMRAASALVA